MEEEGIGQGKPLASDGSRSSLNIDDSCERQDLKGLTIPTTTLFIVGQIAGSGAVAIPNALANTGWVGVPIMFVSALGNLFVAFLLSRCFELLAKENIHFTRHMPDPYTTLVETILGRRAKIFTLVLLHILVISAITVYLLIAAELMSGFINSFVHSFESPNEFRVFVAIFGLVLTPLTFFGTPKEFWGAAFAAVLATVVSVILIIVRLGLKQSSAKFTLENVPERTVTWHTFFSGLGTIMFAFAGVPFFPALYFDMKDKTDFDKAVISGYSVVSLIYFPLSIYGYVILGDNLQSNILNYLIQMPEEGCHGCIVLVYISQLTLGFHFVFGYLLLFNPLAQELEGILGTPKYFSWQRCTLRSLLVLATIILAESVPNFGVMLSLVGGTVSTILTYFIPVLAYLRLEKNISLHMKALMYELLAITCISCIGSLYSATMDLIQLY